jgi:hypothetical protein
MKPDPGAVRDARRQAREAAVARARVERLQVEFGSTARIATDTLRQMLEPELGLLRRLAFGRSPSDPATVTWEALTSDGQVLAGRFVVHTTVAENAISIWAEVVIDRAKAPSAGSTASRGSATTATAGGSGRAR